MSARNGDDQRLDKLRVNERGEVVRPGGFFKAEHKVGEIRGNRAHAPSGLLLPGAEWGYVDDHGDIRLKDGFFRGRKIGEVRGDPKRSLAFFIERFEKYSAFISEVEAEVHRAEHKVFKRNKVKRLLQEAPEQNVLGDLHSVIKRLKILETEIAEQVEDRKRRKKAIHNAAYKLQSSDQWKDTHQRFQELRQELLDIGPADKELDDQYWKDFGKYADEFYRRRKIHYEQVESQYAHNAQMKEQICKQADHWANSSDYKAAGSEMQALWEQWKAAGHAGKDREDPLWEWFNGSRQKFYANRKEWWKNNYWKKKGLISRAQSISSSTDWQATGQEMKKLMADWQDVGSAGPSADDELWRDFQQTRQYFFDRRASHFAQQDRERQDNWQRKEALISQAQSALSLEPRQGKDRIKELQQEWKQIGHVPRERSEELWLRFRAACDAVFHSAAEAGRAKMEAALNHRHEQIRKIEEQLDHDHSNIDRWESTIANLNPGGRADEIEASLREKIHDVSSRIDMKRGWIADHQAVIDNIRLRLR